MIEVRTIEQLTNAIRKLKSDYARGVGTMELIRSLEIDPLTQLRGGDWRGTNFADCDLKGADLSDCRLAFCDFTDADVAGAIFYRSDLFKSTLHRALNVASAYLSVEQREYLDRCRDYDAGSDSDETRVFQINQKIRAASSFQHALAQFETILARGLQPDQYSAALLISRTQNPVEAWEAFRMVENAECPVNDVVFTVLASKMMDAGAVRAVIEKMRSMGFTPNLRIYSTLLARTKRAEDAEVVLAEMETEAIKRNNVTYQILMRRTGFEKNKTLLNRLMSEGLRPGTTELNILMRGAGNEDEADNALEIATELDIGRSSTTYALLAPHKARPNAFDTLVEDMNEDDLARDNEFYTLAIARAKDFRTACFLYGRMKIDEVQPNLRIYYRFSALAAMSLPSPGPNSSLDKEIATLIRSKGAPADIIAAGVGDDIIH
jgi:hypothetical protein